MVPCDVGFAFVVDHLCQDVPLVVVEIVVEGEKLQPHWVVSSSRLVDIAFVMVFVVVVVVVVLKDESDFGSTLASVRHLILPLMIRLQQQHYPQMD